MVDDPIDISSGTIFRQLCRDNIGNNIFVYGSDDDLIFCSFISVIELRPDEYMTNNLFLFRAQHYCDEFEFMINDTEVTKEHWFDVIRAKYPDYFDWFMFHPEYFS